MSEGENISLRTGRMETEGKDCFYRPVIFFFNVFFSPSLLLDYLLNLKTKGKILSGEAVKHDG